MSCCYDHRHCHWGHHSTTHMPFYPHYAAPPREDYVRMLEDECGMLEQRLRRLERELAELRRSGTPATREPTS
jgi:hypothetical protein